MVEEWKRAEVLLEDIKHDVKAIAEGHSVLNRRMDTLEINLRKEIKEVKDELHFVAKELNDKIDAVDRRLGDKIDRVDSKLDAHMRQPAHS